MRLACWRWCPAIANFSRTVPLLDGTPEQKIVATGNFAYTAWHERHTLLDMKWGHIISEVAVLYFKLAFVYLAYHGAKVFIAHNRPSLKPPFTKRIGGYLRCIAAIAFIAMLASANFEGENEDSHVVSVDYSRGAIVFLALLFPALIGAAEGYASREQFPTASGSNYDDV